MKINFKIFIFYKLYHYSHNSHYIKIHILQVSKVVALLHRAADMEHVPTLKETKFLLPKPALSARYIKFKVFIISLQCIKPSQTCRDIKPPQWVNMVQGSWAEVQDMSASRAKGAVLQVGISNISYFNFNVHK